MGKVGPVGPILNIKYNLWMCFSTVIHRCFCIMCFNTVIIQMLILLGEAGEVLIGYVLIQLPLSLLALEEITVGSRVSSPFFLLFVFVPFFCSGSTVIPSFLGWFFVCVMFGHCEFVC